MHFAVLWRSTLLLAFVLAATPRVAHAALWNSERKELALNTTRDLWYHGYDHYMRYAFPLDELTPLSCMGRGPNWDNPADIVYNDVDGNFSLTLIDVLDTLPVLGDHKEFEKAVRYTIDWVSFDVNTRPQLFETNIRVLGGLLSAHQYASKGSFKISWYKDELLHMALDLGERLLPAFETPTGIPYARVNLRKGVLPSETVETCTAGAGSLILEFGVLSRLTGDGRFEKAASKAFFALWNRRSDINLVGNTINTFSGKWTHPEVGSIGAGVDSFYEYALKWYILSGEIEYLDVWLEGYAAIMRYSRIPTGYSYRPVNIHSGDAAYGMLDSLSAFWPGLQVLAGDVQNAIKSHLTFWNLWKRHSGLPEMFDQNYRIATSWQYPLRPEFIESTWYLYRATGDPFYLDVGERILNDIITRAKVDCGLTGIGDLRTNHQDDRMESFVLSETLKYLFLLFDEANPLHSDESNYVFTTEGHVLRMETSQMRPMSNVRRKLRGPERHTCPVYEPTNKASFLESKGGLLTGINARSDVDYAGMLIGTAYSDNDSAHWSPDGWCTVPPVQLYSYSYILASDGKSTAEDLTPSTKKLEVMSNGIGYAIRNITGLRITITLRLDGDGYDVTKLGPYTVHSGQTVYVDDPELAVDEPKPMRQREQRQPIITLRFFPDYQGGVDSMVEMVIPDIHVTEDLVISAFTSIFGGDPVAAPVEGTESLKFGHHRGVPLVRDLTNPLGCTAYPDTYNGEALLVARGDCTFLEKLHYAQQAGASGVIVISDNDKSLHPSTTPSELAAVDKGIDKVVVVVIKKTDGDSLNKLMDDTERTGGRVWAVVEPLESLVEPSDKRGVEEQTKPVKDSEEPRILYLNGHALVNTRLLI